MSGRQLEVFNKRAELAPDTIIQQIIDFEQLVYEMRSEQKAYFSCKDPNRKKSYLSRSKQLEKQVDHRLGIIGYGDNTLF